METGEGSVEKYYVSIPEEIPGLKLEVNVHLDGVPEEFRLAPLRDVCTEYLNRINVLVQQAVERYCR